MDAELKNAASAMGKKGGKSRSEKKVVAARKNIKKALAVFLAEDSFEKRHNAQMSVPLEKRVARSKNALRIRWEKRKKDPGMSNDEFRRLIIIIGHKISDVAMRLNMKKSKVYSWTRVKNPVPISAEDTKKILTFFENLRGK